MRTLAIILSALIFISCKNSASTATETKLLPVATTEINTGHNGRFNKKITQIIKTEEAFKAAWKLAFANYSTKEPLPEVNFDTDEIILVTMGEQNSGGNSIEVTKVEASIGFLVALDSRSETIPLSSELKVKKSNHYVNIIRLPNYDFLNTLRTKLIWGMDKRN